MTDALYCSLPTCQLPKVYARRGRVPWGNHQVLALRSGGSDRTTRGSASQSARGWSGSNGDSRLSELQREVASPEYRGKGSLSKVSVSLLVGYPRIGVGRSNFKIGRGIGVMIGSYLVGQF